MRIIGTVVFSAVLLAGGLSPLLAEDLAAEKPGPVYTLAMEGMT